VLSRQRLEQALYGFDEVLDSNALEVHMHHLRRKLGDGLVKTVRGVGYYVPVAPADAPASVQETAAALLPQGLPAQGGATPKPGHAC
jgi:DNA-binding winged helix-turn-helix (wHTH) protein